MYLPERRIAGSQLRVPADRARHAPVACNTNVKQIMMRCIVVWVWHNIKFKANFFMNFVGLLYWGLLVYILHYQCRHFVNYVMYRIFSNKCMCPFTACKVDGKLIRRIGANILISHSFFSGEKSRYHARVRTKYLSALQILDEELLTKIWNKFRNAKKPQAFIFSKLLSSFPQLTETLPLKLSTWSTFFNWSMGYHCSLRMGLSAFASILDMK